MDETVTVPIYAIAFVGFIILPWMIHLHLKSNANSEANAVTKANIVNIKDDLHELSQRVDGGMSKIDGRIDKIEDKIDKIYIEVLRGK